MHDRTKLPTTYRKPKPMMGMKAETLRFTVNISEPELDFTNAVAIRKRRQRDREALDLQRCEPDRLQRFLVRRGRLLSGLDWPCDRLLRALTVEWLTDTGAP
jgi:hypothetical protein